MSTIMKNGDITKANVNNLELGKNFKIFRFEKLYIIHIQPFFTLQLKCQRKINIGYVSGAFNSSLLYHLCSI